MNRNCVLVLLFFSWFFASGQKTAIAGEKHPAAICHLYSISPSNLLANYDNIVRACHEQGITRFYLLVSVTGKLTASPEQIRSLKKRLEGEGLQVFPLIFSIGHPNFGPYYKNGKPPAKDFFYEGKMVWNRKSEGGLWLLPRGWQYAKNEFGNSVYCSACPNKACIAGNQAVMKVIASIFDTVWYDDEFRMDGEQGAGHPCSTACCYCNDCLHELSKRLGRSVTREDILASQELHEAWIEYGTDKLATMWKTLYETGKAVNPNLSMGLMVRWGGEEIDGLDIDKLLPYFGKKVNLRLGEGHFSLKEYRQPRNQAIEYLVASYHASWYPQDASLLTETTYYSGITREFLLKKVALGLAAGASEVAYCPCVANYVLYQSFLADDRSLIDTWSHVFRDKTALYEPVAIVRTRAAGYGDKTPTKRIRGRQPFPLFALAGLCSTVVRQHGWRDTKQLSVVAVTGRSVWDFDRSRHNGCELILDGTALLQHSPLNKKLGIDAVRQSEDGKVDFHGDFVPDGLLYTNGRVTIIPYVWYLVPKPLLEKLLLDIRRVVGRKVKSVVANGSTYVLPVHYRYPDRDIIMLVNLTSETRQIVVKPSPERPVLKTLAGKDVLPTINLGADEIRLLIATP